MKVINVLLVSIHSEFSETVKSVLGKDSRFLITAEAFDGITALEQCHKLRPEIVLICSICSEKHSLQQIRKIRDASPASKIVLFTECNELNGFFTAMQYGAQGYLHTGTDPEVWLQYVNALVDNDEKLSGIVAQHCIEPFLQHKLLKTSHQKITVREMEIVKCIAKGETNKQIACKLHISENTVRNHVKNILSKLSLQNRVQLTVYAVRNGIYKTTG